jgi:ATP/maltotriose-dependent transcriptional regulator MalT
VKFHLSNIYRKLEVGNRTQAAARARALGLFSDDFSMERSG